MHVLTGSRIRTYGCARELANEFRKGAVGKALPASPFPAFPRQHPQRDGHHWSRDPISSVVETGFRKLATRLLAASGLALVAEADSVAAVRSIQGSGA